MSNHNPSPTPTREDAQHLAALQKNMSTSQQVQSAKGFRPPPLAVTPGFHARLTRRHFVPRSAVTILET